MARQTAEQSHTQSDHTGVSRVGGEVEVGYDSAFEDKWWKFEMSSWVALIIFLAAALLGVLGRGLLSKAQVISSDGSFKVKYDRVVHFRTPAEITIEFGPAAVHNNSAQFWVGQTFFKQLKLQGILPAPLQQAPNGAGMLLDFPVSTNAPRQSVSLRLEPSSVGAFNSEVAAPGGNSVRFSTLVLP
jgi:hypothetical protein